MTSAEPATKLLSNLEISTNDFVMPDYAGACISRVVPAILDRLGKTSGLESNDALSANSDLRANIDPIALSPSSDGFAWLPDIVGSASQVVLFVIDGLGWEQLRANSDIAPVLSSMVGRSITSVAPTTTATALTSIAMGRTPSEHGVMGYRIRVNEVEVLNVLKWQIDGNDARSTVKPASIQARLAFRGQKVPVVSRTEFLGTGFTDAYLTGSHIQGWRVCSSIPVEVRRLLGAGEPFLYVYYDGIDKVAHEKGLGDHYRAELQATDRLVGDLLAVLPRDACLVVTADHGQVEVLEPPIELPPSITKDVSLMSGEGRFRWLHVASDALDRVREECIELIGDRGIVASREDLVRSGLFGSIPPSREFAQRLGDLALIAIKPVAFFDEFDTGELRLISRHGALTSAEVLVPLLAATSK